MKLHEYQGKEIFRSFSIPTPRGYLIEDINNAENDITRRVIQGQVTLNPTASPKGATLLETGNKLLLES